MSTGELSEERIREIYEQKIKPRLFNEVIPSNNKTCVFVGGQPGAGKGNLTDHTINQLENRDAVVINSDILRPYHPNTPYTQEKDIYSLDPDCYKWGNMLIADCIKENKNIVFDGTFGGNNGANEKLMQVFKDNGYKTKVNLLATNDVVSTIGFNYRYERGKFEDGASRIVNKEYHDSIYQKMPENIQSTAKMDLIDEYNIYERNHVNPGVYVSKTYTGEQVKSDPGKLVNDFENARIRPFTDAEFETIKTWHEKTVDFMIKNGGDVRQFQASIVTKDKGASGQLIKQIGDIANSSSVNEKMKAMKENQKQEEIILKGYVGKDSKQEILPSGKKVIEFDVAQIVPGKDEVKWNKVQAWDALAENLPEVKKGDSVELKGYSKTAVGKDQKERTHFVTTQVLKFTPKQTKEETKSVSLEGRIGADAEKRQIQTKTGPLDVVKFSIAIESNGKEVKWQNCTVYGKDLEKTKAGELKKGDSVKMEGQYSKEFTNNRGEKKQDFAVKTVEILKLAEKQSESATRKL